jgi:hypothetical protein
VASNRRPRFKVVRGTPAADAIAGMDEDHLLCRDFGHNWRPWTAQWVPQHRHYVESLVCTRCETTRHRQLDEWGGRLGNTYTYPDGYLLQNVGRLTEDDRNGIRLAGLQAVIRATGGDHPSQQLEGRNP